MRPNALYWIIRGASSKRSDRPPDCIIGEKVTPWCRGLDQSVQNKQEEPLSPG